MTPLLKVAAYIVRPHAEGLRLLAFRHRDFPEIALEPPGGTVDPGEPLEAAIRREIEEESGLTGLTLIDKIGEVAFVWEGLPHIRHFFLFYAPPDAPDSWEHIVTGSGEDAGIAYAYEWLAPAEFGRLHRWFQVFLQELNGRIVPGGGDLLPDRGERENRQC